jgi:glyoxylase-like metal-dependent hydrolase (beta-lactamase superfamily II)
MEPRAATAMGRLAEMQQNGAGEIIEAVRRVLEAESTDIEWEAPDEWLRPGRIEIGGRILDAVATPGHTAGHLVFHDSYRAQMFTGDHVLPTITPSIGFEATPMGNPLRDFMNSLAKVRSMPDARLLSAHGPVTDSVHARVDELIAHHGARLDATEAAVRGRSATAYEIAQVLPWTRRLRGFDELDPFNQMLAVNETAAHLLLLVSQKRCVMTTDIDVRRFG